MRRELVLFLSALQFFTRLPVPAWVGHSSEQLNAAARYFPAVGTLVGMLVSAVLWASSTILPLGIALLLSMACGIFITGAFHEDGLTDYADGMGGGFTKARVLEIMKDSRIGAYGAITIAITLCLKYQAVIEIATRISLFSACLLLIAAHTLSRFAAFCIMAVLPYVREDDTSRAKPVVQSLSAWSISVALVYTLIVVVVVAIVLVQIVGLNQLVALRIAAYAVVFLLLAWGYMVWRLKARLQGYTGDCLGATQQLCEVAIYLGVVAGTVPF